MTTSTRQEYRDLEKLGYLCRWILLAGAAAVVLAAAWAGLSETITISSGLKTEMLIPNSVWRQGSSMTAITGFLDRPAQQIDTPLMLFQDHRGNLKFIGPRRHRGEMTSYLRRPPAGTHKITLSGVPYGPMAFIQQDTSVRIVPHDMTVYLLDARFLADVEKNDKQAAIRIAEGFTDLGQLVLICPPRREMLKELPAELIRYSDIPRVFSLRKDKGDPMSVIASLTWSLKDRRKAANASTLKPYVVTADIKLAIETARNKYFTHLIASENIPAKLPEMIRLHANADKLADHLADESPTHLPIP